MVSLTGPRAVAPLENTGRPWAASAAESRTSPCKTMPATPRSRAAYTRMSPISAVSRPEPPSITRTSPWPAISTAR